MFHSRFPLVALVVLLFPLTLRAEGPSKRDRDARAAFVAKYRVGSCFKGPVEIRVMNPDGSPAVGMPVGIKGTFWLPKKGFDTPQLSDRTPRTDAQGRCGLESFYECMFPTMFYSFDTERRLAGIRICEAIGDLMEPQVIRLVPARWVTGEVVSSELAEYGLTSSYYRVQLYPANPINGRELRQHGKSPRFRFLAPPGEYVMSFQGEHLEFRRHVKLFVPRGEGTIDLGRIELRAKGVLRLKGKSAPGWLIDEWLDGEERTLASFRGRYVLLCFWQDGSDPVRTIRNILRLRRAYGGDKLAVVVVHVSVRGGLDVVRRHVAAWESEPDVKGLDLNIDRWPVLLALDRKASILGDGQTCDRYGGSVFSRFLIDPQGRIVAAAECYDLSELEAALKRLVGR
ncbi:MAG: TlpA family protein disulfide reductase [Phycisphaerae bacterium]